MAIVARVASDFHSNVSSNINDLKIEEIVSLFKIMRLCAVLIVDGGVKECEHFKANLGSHTCARSTLLSVLAKERYNIIP